MVAAMASKIRKLGDDRVVALPAELLAQLEWAVGDLLAAELVEGGIKLTRTKSKHARAMEIAARPWINIAKQ
jgi:antitoxin component of MazEF toxin-antitoxin module